MDHCEKSLEEILRSVIFLVAIMTECEYNSICMDGKNSFSCIGDAALSQSSGGVPTNTKEGICCILITIQHSSLLRGNESETVDYPLINSKKLCWGIALLRQSVK